VRRLLYAAFVAVLVLTLWTIRPAGADHDQVYAPCDPEDTRPLDEKVWYQDYQSGAALRFDDPWWAEQGSFLVPWATNWYHQCRLGMTGVWQAAPILPLPHPPTLAVESRDAIEATTTTTTIPPAPSTTQPPPTTTQGIPAPPDQPETTDPAPTTAQPPATATIPVPGLGVGSGLPDGYDLWDAEYDGWPFEQTIILLEDRYPPGTPDRFHFRLSAAVEFLRQGGMVGGLDFLWGSGG
jgi:hypothetical protein